MREHTMPIYKTTHVHKKTGGRYAVIGRGKIEADLTPCVVYQKSSTGEIWVRPAAEFDDGRFIELDTDAD